jgi:hypothetical protein
VASPSIFIDKNSDTALLYNTYEYAFGSEDPFIQAVNTYCKQNGVMPEITANILTYATVSSTGYNKSNTAYARITQVYVDVTYEYITSTNMNIRCKTNGVWKPVTKAYQKQSGV